MNRAATVARWCPPAHHAADVTLLTVNVLEATRRGTRRPAQRDPRHPGRVLRDRDARSPAGMTATRASASTGSWTGGPRWRTFAPRWPRPRADDGRGPWSGSAGNHAYGLEFGVGGVRNEHAGFHAAAQVLNDLRCDHFTRRYGGHARWGGADQLGTDPADRLVDGNLFGGSEERVARSHRHLQLQGTRWWNFHRGRSFDAVGTGHQRLQRLEQTPLCLLVVGVCDRRLDAPGIDRADVDVTGPHPLARLVTGHPERIDIDRDLQRIDRRRLAAA